jgi:hypothetical protein
MTNTDWNPNVNPVALVMVAIITAETMESFGSAA